jgi:lysozyme family protein
MAANNREPSISLMLGHEGGYSNHPSDPGGPTNFGITIHDYRRYLKPGATAADVRAMRLDDAKAIYRAKYWAALRCDELPSGLDYALFDYGVNSGVGRAGKVLRRVLGLSDETHAVSDGVLAAACARDATWLVTAICDERLAFLRRLKTWPVFGAGWSRRVAEVRAAAFAMAGQTRSASRPPSVVRSPSPASGKGAVPVNSRGQKATAGGIAAAGAATAQQAHQAGLRPAVVVIIVAIAIVLATAGWFWWRRRQRQLQEA